MTMDKQLLAQQAEQLGCPLTDSMLEKFAVYASLLVEWNEKINLTAITDPTDIVYKHFVDSLTLCSMVPHKAFSLIDVGTGAGFPGIPIAIVRSDVKLTLLDSLNKRLLFLKAVCDELGIAVTLIHARAEEAGVKADYREQYDLATARAVASLPVLCEYCLPFVKVGGKFVAMKGPEGENEVMAAQKAITVLGGKLEKVEKRTIATVQESYERQLIVIDKMTQTPSKYPRMTAKIKKQSL